MFRIYSPDNYFSLFGKYPAIFVEDSGLMYSQKEYTALLRNPIGKIDFTTGYLYGSNCLSSFATPIGQIVYGIGCGALTVIFRYFGLYPEGVTYAILIMNVLVWVIDYYTPIRRFGTRRGGAAK